MANDCVFDAGPFIHINEIDELRIFKLFHKILTTEEILNECRRIKEVISRIKNVECKQLLPESKDFARYVSEKYFIDLGESTGIALCKQERIELFFTDDLDARDTARHLGFDAHGTIAVLVRAFREKILTKNETVDALDRLHKQSSLFVTKEIVYTVVKEIERFSKD